MLFRLFSELASLKFPSYYVSRVKCKNLLLHWSNNSLSRVTYICGAYLENDLSENAAPQIFINI